MSPQCILNPRIMQHSSSISLPSEVCKSLHVIWSLAISWKCPGGSMNGQITVRNECENQYVNGKGANWLPESNCVSYLHWRCQAVLGWQLPESQELLLRGVRTAVSHCSSQNKVNKLKGLGQVLASECCPLQTYPVRPMGKYPQDKALRNVQVFAVSSTGLYFLREMADVINRLPFPIYIPWVQIEQGNSHSPCSSASMELGLQINQVVLSQWHFLRIMAIKF